MKRATPPTSHLGAHHISNVPDLTCVYQLTCLVPSVPCTYQLTCSMPKTRRSTTHSHGVAPPPPRGRGRGRARGVGPSLSPPHADPSLSLGDVQELIR